MDSVTKWEYLTAWRYTGEQIIPRKGLLGGNEKVALEVLKVGKEDVAAFDIKLDELGSRGWELVTETPHVSEELPGLFAALTSVYSTISGRVTTEGYRLVLKRPSGAGV